MHGEESSSRSGHLGRAASLPVLGTERTRSDKYDAPCAPAATMPTPKASTVTVTAFPSGTKAANSYVSCTKHNLPGCFLCGRNGAHSPMAREKNAYSLDTSDAPDGTAEPPPLVPSGSLMRSAALKPRSFSPPCTHAFQLSLHRKIVAADHGEAAAQDDIFGGDVQRSARITPETSGRFLHHLRTAKPARGDVGIEDALRSHPRTMAAKRNTEGVGDVHENRSSYGNLSAHSSNLIRPDRRTNRSPTKANNGNAFNACEKRNGYAERHTGKQNASSTTVAKRKKAGGVRGEPRRHSFRSGNSVKKRILKSLVSGGSRRRSAQADTASSGARARERGGLGNDINDLAARAMTAALAVLE